MISEVFNEDNMVGMARYPDKYFDLAIVDPPYGINASKGTWGSSNLGNVTNYGKKKWDDTAPDSDYFSELFRVSKNQIVWGANHFIGRMPINSPCWIVWDKDNSGDFADCELAFTSFTTSVRKFKFRWNGMLQQDMKNKEPRIHPTQKPVALYKWLLENYAKQGDKILDTHMGSQSSRIAAYKMGFDYYGWELDPDYFAAGNKRFENEIAQQQLFMPEQPAIIKPQTLF
jgi:site-specific DNA-methyltransferase (adenine-specific)